MIIFNIYPYLYIDYPSALLRRNGNDEKLLKIDYVVSRRASINIFQGQSSDIGKFAKEIIEGFSEGQIVKTAGKLAEGVINKIFGASSGSAQTERL